MNIIIMKNREMSHSLLIILPSTEVLLEFMIDTFFGGGLIINTKCFAFSKLIESWLLSRSDQRSEIIIYQV